MQPLELLIISVKHTGKGGLRLKLVRSKSLKNLFILPRQQGGGESRRNREGTTQSMKDR